jgi:hypothetical protein
MATQYTAGIVQGQKWTAAIANQIGAAWETFTPTFFSGTGQATTSTATGAYCLINKIATVHIYMNASGSGGAGIVEARGIPAAITPKRTGSTNNSNGAELGTAGYLDAGTAYYLAQGYFTSATALRLIVAGGVDLSLTAASGDKLWITTTYEVA